MRLLLDTHAFLRFVLGDPRLVQTALDRLLDPKQVKLMSPVSNWEIAIKISLGKYTLNEPYEAFVQGGIFGNGFSTLPIEPKHTALLTTLPFHHRDPCDRLLVAQALVEQVPVLSADPALDAYGITRLW
jgi:PIN domain nuclease of toxin-antitoxin system